ncbi:hypothetical protein CGGC5_v009150 [Colletotrichum fructicola Nara gc5]|uniref:Uncharacterized protein n=1 Tax=Colletotrichum fructicola (strain Nara gc5) TaxID=1213859 RepID=A0A7J6J1P4_COLFN|nr:hypothetical protein CGGC5_v009150 [Colletotrichum fructicola Nara gc5]KAF4887898.1 hypothetical protein CGCFRS4_v010176 [Colletotrichum fructicola]
MSSETPRFDMASPDTDLNQPISMDTTVTCLGRHSFFRSELALICKPFHTQTSGNGTPHAKCDDLIMWTLDADLMQSPSLHHRVPGCSLEHVFYRGTYLPIRSYSAYASMHAYDNVQPALVIANMGSGSLWPMSPHRLLIFYARRVLPSGHRHCTFT